MFWEIARRMNVPLRFAGGEAAMDVRPTKTQILDLITQAEVANNAADTLGWVALFSSDSRRLRKQFPAPLTLDLDWGGALYAICAVQWQWPYAAFTFSLAPRHGAIFSSTWTAANEIRQDLRMDIIT